MPNKRQRSSQSTTDLPLKTTENGHRSTPVNLAPVSEALTPLPPPKERPDLKSPQLPFGENVAVATGAVAAQ